MRRRLLLQLACLPGLALAQVPQLEVNTASRAQLESLPGIGPALAARLLAARPFSDWTDLMRRTSGVRAATARKLSEAGLRVDGQAYSDDGRRETR